MGKKFFPATAILLVFHALSAYPRETDINVSPSQSETPKSLTNPVDLRGSGSETVYALAGVHITLRCRHENTEVARWYATDSNARNGTVSVDGFVVKQEESTLLVVASNSNPSKSYKCEIEDNSNAVVFQSGWIEIAIGRSEDGPRTFGLPSNDVRYEQVEDAKLDYAVMSSPPASVHWECFCNGMWRNASLLGAFQNDVLLRVNTSEIEKFRICRMKAENFIGEANGKAKLGRDVLSVLECETPDRKIYCDESSITLCYFESKEKPSITIIHNGVVLSDKSRISVNSHISTAGGFHNGTVSLTNVSPCSAGTYQITLVDSFGEEWMEIVQVDIHCNFLGIRRNVVRQTHTLIELGIKNFICDQEFLFQNVSIEAISLFSESDNESSFADTVKMSNKLNSLSLLPVSSAAIGFEFHSVAHLLSGALVRDRISFSAAFCTRDHGGPLDDPGSEPTSFPPGSKLTSLSSNKQTSLPGNVASWEDCVPSRSSLRFTPSSLEVNWIVCHKGLKLRYWSEGHKDIFNRVLLPSSQNSTTIRLYMEANNNVTTRKSPTGLPVETTGNNVTTRKRPTGVPVETTVEGRIVDDRLLVSTVVMSVLFAISCLVVAYLCFYLRALKKRRVTETTPASVQATNNIYVDAN